MKTEKKEVEFTLVEDMLGTIPRNKELYREWIATKNPDPIDVTAEELETVIDGEKGLTGFHTIPEDGIYIMDYFVKGYFKSTGNTYKEILGIKNLSSKLTNFIFIYPRLIRISAHSDGTIERPLRAMTPQGPRVALAQSEFVRAGTSFRCKIGLYPHKEITWKKIEAIMDFGEEGIGFGQWRNAGYGRFTWKWV